MTQKGKPVSKRSAATRKAAAPTAPAVAGREGEVAQLRKQLAAAEGRIAELERQRDEALNRIAWVIDSLNSLTESAK